MAAPQLDFGSAQQIAPDVAEIGVMLMAVQAARNPSVKAGKLSIALVTSGVEWLKAASDRAVVVFPLVLTVSSTNDAGEVAEMAKLSLQYHIIYVFRQPLQLSDAELESFLAYYGCIHIWPYARAEFQQLSVKIDLPPIILPVLRNGVLPSGFTITQLTPDELTS